MVGVARLGGLKPNGLPQKVQWREKLSSWRLSNIGRLRVQADTKLGCPVFSKKPRIFISIFK